MQNITSNRITEFHKLSEHPWLHKTYKRLSKEHITFCESFIKDNDHLGHLEFEYAINRMFLDKVKPYSYKHIAIIQELLTCCNSAVHIK